MRHISNFDDENHYMVHIKGGYVVSIFAHDYLEPAVGDNYYVFYDRITTLADFSKEERDVARIHASVVMRVEIVRA